MSHLVFFGNGGGGGTPIITIDGDVGSVSGSTVAFNALNIAGSTVEFSGSGTTMQLKFADVNNNTMLGPSTGVPSGDSNTAVGYQAMGSPGGCIGGVAIGHAASFNDAGFDNVGVGTFALGRFSSGAVSGNFNVSVGFGGLSYLQTGAQNISIGYGALGIPATSVGVTTGSNNIAIGGGNGSNVGAGSNYASSESWNIILGSNKGTLGESGVTRIGNADGNGGTPQTACYIEGIDGVNVGSTATVVTEASNQLGTAVITAGSGISVTPGANTITIANTATSSITITGDSGGGLTGNSFTFTGGTTGLTFAGAGTTETLGGTLVVSNGGTGISTTTAYAPICGGTTSTGAFQAASTGLSTSGNVLTSNGSSAVPSFQAPAFVGSPTSFLAYLTSTLTNVTGDGTAVNPVVFDTTLSNTGSNYNTGTGVFTAPTTGLYLFGTNMLGQNLIGGVSQFTVAFVTTARTYYLVNGFAAANGNSTANPTLLAPMTAGDTCSVYFQVSGGTKTVSIYGAAGDARTNFYGYQVA